MTTPTDPRTDPHAPTDEFVEYLARDTARMLRHEGRFGAAAAAAQPARARRFPNTFGIAAGVALTLATGMVLGASANYASAEVLPNGTTTIPARPTLAILPIKNALSAIGCTQAAPTAPKPTRAAIVASPDSIVEDSPAQVVRLTPDRAKISALATQHMAAVVRGDSVAEYIVMVLGAAGNYVWGTHGNGNVSIEVGADPRTPLERREYHAQYRNEFGELLFTRALLRDSTYFRMLHTARGDSFTAKRLEVRFDSMARKRSIVADSSFRMYVAAAASGAAGRVAGERGGGASASDSLPGVYATGWSAARYGPLYNQASGLAQRGPGESGIVGLASANVRGADTYTFAPGELAPMALRIVVVQLTPGTTWTGR